MTTSGTDPSDEVPALGDVYIRDGAGDERGLQQQAEGCRGYAAELGLELAVEPGSDRAGFDALLEQMRNGGVDTVVYSSVDRLAHSRENLDRLLDTALATGSKLTTVDDGPVPLQIFPTS